MNKGKLYLIPSLLAETSAEHVIPQSTLHVIRQLDHFIIEELRTARRFLKKAGILKAIDELDLKEYNEHAKNEDLLPYLNPALEGHDIGLLSEAGTPCIADPGNLIVELAHQLNIRVIPLSGPSSIILALMASGFNGQNFAFVGYLPIERNLRIKRIRELETIVREKDQTQIFIEAPYRNNQLFAALTDVCKGDTHLCLAIDITAENEIIAVKNIREWRKEKPELNKRPTVFLLYH